MRTRKIVAGLAAVWLTLMIIGTFGAITGNTWLLVVAVIAGIPVAFFISMIMRQYNPK